MKESDTARRRQTDDRVTAEVAGTRGGLGRILLTAFMLLAIVPLSIVSYLAIRRVQHDLRESAVDNVARIASAGASELQSWLNARQYGVSAVARDVLLLPAIESGRWQDACSRFQNCSPYCAYLILSLQVSGRESVLCETERATAPNLPPLTLTAPIVDPEGTIVASVIGYPKFDALDVSHLVSGQHGIEVFLVDPDGEWIVPLIESSFQSADSGRVADLVVPLQETVGAGFYQDVEGNMVLGSYRPLTGWDAAVWVELPEEALLAREDDLAAMLIGSTLAVALLTAVLAAVVTRQITRPIVHLTVSAVRVAGGDLEQSVRLDRRDEIGVLARAFNVMTTELRSLYANLERKVAQRTRQLTDANRELRYKAMQLRLGAEVGRVATSILDLEMLLHRVTELILDTYARVYDVHYVAIWLREGFEERLERRSCQGEDTEDTRSYVAIGDSSLIGRTALDGQLTSQPFEERSVAIAVPLRVTGSVIGILELHCSRSDSLGPDEGEVLQSLGDQISVAIENARLYTIEHEAVERLSRLDDLRLASLGVGSRELATELNTIIGFSRLILKGADGPLTDLQQADLLAIHKSGYKLLGLIDNVITLSELESGAVDIDRERLELATLLLEVRAKAEQRLAGSDIEWRDVSGMPPVIGDRALLQQAFVGLLSATTEQVLEGTVSVSARAEHNHDPRVVVQMGTMADETNVDLSLIAEVDDWKDDLEEMSVNLALAHRIIEMHGGELKFVFDPEASWSSIVVLPVARESFGL